MPEARPMRHSEYVRIPCDLEPTRRQSWTAELHDIAMVLTVERCYPGEIDAFLQGIDPHDSLLATRFIEEKYSQAFLDFGFAQARGLELGLLARSLRHCESRVQSECPACPLRSLGDDFGERIDSLRELAESRGISSNGFARIYRLSAAAAVPEAYEDHDPTENALALLTSEC